MKDQYFGDVNDYRKYGLLRLLLEASGLRLLVTWMLTPGDGGTDGGKIEYLSQPAKFAGYDPHLFQALGGFVRSPDGRRVSLIEESDLLRGAGYYSELVPDARDERGSWFGSLETAARGYDLVFLDPDNGLEIRSKPIGRKGSSKYVGWSEVERLWAGGSSLLIYQHFARVPRSEFTRQKASQLQTRLGAPLIEAFTTAGVLFLLVGQDRHSAALREGIERVRTNWPGQIGVAGLSS